MSQCAWGPHDDWNPYIVGPIRSTCQREIEALRNSMRTNTRATSRYDRRSGRRKKEAARCGGLVSASTMRDLFQLRRDARERRIQLCAETVDDGNNRNGNAGGNQAVFDGRGCRFILQEPNKKLRHGCALGLPSSPGQQHTRFPLSVCKLTYCKLGKANPENLNKKARNWVGTRARASTAHLGCTAQVRFCGQQKAPANPGFFSAFAFTTRPPNAAEGLSRLPAAPDPIPPVPPAPRLDHMIGMGGGDTGRKRRHRRGS